MSFYHEKTQVLTCIQSVSRIEILHHKFSDGHFASRQLSKVTSSSTSGQKRYFKVSVSSARWIEVLAAAAKAPRLQGSAQPGSTLSFATSTATPLFHTNPFSFHTNQQTQSPSSLQVV